jgi:hypothetical protein
MSLKVTGSNTRLSVRMPAEGQTLVRQGDEMIGADAGGAATSVEGLPDTPVTINSQGNVEISAGVDPGVVGDVIIKAAEGGPPSTSHLSLIATRGQVLVHSEEGVQIEGRTSVFVISSIGPVRLQAAPADVIGEYGAEGSAQRAPIADVTDLPTALAAINALLVYFRARGTIATV